MGLVYAELELINAWELEASKKNLIGQDEVKRMWVTALVDSGAAMFTISEELQEILQFPVVEKRPGETADGRIVDCKVVNCVEIRFNNRRCTVQAMVLPGCNEPLLGAIPMEDMDVIIDPKRQQLIPHPDHPLGPLMKIKKAS